MINIKKCSKNYEQGLQKNAKNAKNAKNSKSAKNLFHF